MRHCCCCKYVILQVQRRCHPGRLKLVSHVPGTPKINSSSLCCPHYVLLKSFSLIFNIDSLDTTSPPSSTDCAPLITASVRRRPGSWCYPLYLRTVKSCVERFSGRSPGVVANISLLTRCFAPKPPSAPNRRFAQDNVLSRNSYSSID